MSTIEHARPPGRSGGRRILVIEDESGIRAVLADVLRAEVERVLEAESGGRGLAVAAAEPPDLIVLDLGLPDLDGIDVCRRLRTWTNAPIVVLSARHSEDEKTALLDAGADDYVTKPFGPAELRARIRALLRRASMPRLAPGDVPATIGDLTIDPVRRTVTRGGSAVHLTPTEWGLLAVLVTNAGRTVTHRQLFDAVWGPVHGDAGQYLRVYVAHLRRKLEADPYAPRHIVTEPGVGYRFEPVP